MAEPILKWAGGKRQLLEQIYTRFPGTFNRFHEPFFGAGTLFFDLEPEAGTINDTNPRLVNFYRQVRDRPTELIEIAKTFRDPESPPDPDREFGEMDRKGRPIKNYYYQQRALFNRRPYGDDFDPVEEGALLLYVNRTCFNGLYRENSKGGFNVPIGRYKNPDWVRAKAIRKASQLLEDVQVLNEDFTYILNHAEEGDLVYCDPPYEPMSATANFNDYSAGGFDKDDQLRLVETASTLADRGVHIILSNSGVMYEHYDEAGFHTEIEGATRAINSDASNRGEVDEIIATNIPPAARAPYGDQTEQVAVTEF